ncbi:MAG: TauD/TfdA family dioxygenase [Caulobacter sp.]|nr:TauD/TfdA family dioxygenase [Caulobacter sp.]
MAGDYETIVVTPQESGFGAGVAGLDLRRPLDPAVLAQVREAWTRHSVLYFPDQPLSLDELEQFTLQLGPFGVDPFIKPMPGRPNVLELRREPDEKATNFGAGWHSDWSFQAEPPAATLLHAKVVPPVGGDTLYADAYRAWDDLSEAMKTMLSPLRAVHSARQAYGPNGVFARETEARTLQIIVSEAAEATVSHPLIVTHPVSGRKAIFASPVYTVGIEGMTREEGMAILRFLFEHMTREDYVYRHRWAPQMLTLWDNCCTLHFADGGYDGHLRVMHRTTVAGERPR